MFEYRAEPNLRPILTSEYGDKTTQPVSYLRLRHFGAPKLASTWPAPVAVASMAGKAHGHRLDRYQYSIIRPH